MFNLNEDLTIYTRDKFLQIKKVFDSFVSHNGVVLIPLKVSDKVYFKRNARFKDEKTNKRFEVELTIEDRLLSDLFKNIHYFKLNNEYRIELFLKEEDKESFDSCFFSKSYVNDYYWHKYTMIGGGSYKNDYDFNDFYVYEYSLKEFKDEYINILTIDSYNKDLIDRIKSGKIKLFLGLRDESYNKIMERESPFYLAKKYFLNQNSVINSVFTIKNEYINEGLKQKIALYAFVFHGLDIFDQHLKIDLQKLNKIRSTHISNFGLKKIEDIEYIINSAEKILKILDKSHSKKERLIFIIKAKVIFKGIKNRFISAGVSAYPFKNCEDDVFIKKIVKSKVKIGFFKRIIIGLESLFF